MSLESLFEQILCTEHQAEESRRVMQEVKSEVAKCCEKIKKATERLHGEKIQLEDKAQKCSEKSFILQLLKTHENALEKQYSKMENQRSELLQILENTKKNLAEEEATFLKEIADFNNKFEITKNWELLMKENAEMEISGLENEAKDLKSEIKSLECDQLNELQKEKSELLQELSTLQKKLKVLKDEENEAICTTKYLEAEKIKIKEKPQNNAECLRLQKELDLYKEDDMGSVCEALQTEIEILESTLAQKNLQGK